MKTLVNIFDPDEPLAAYLFLKQYYAEGDRLLFIATRENRQLLGRYAALFNLPDAQIDFIAFKRDEDSYIFERISRRLSSLAALARCHLLGQPGRWHPLSGSGRPACFFPVQRAPLLRADT